jgi:protein-arginine kinase activator protein McsA
METYLIVLFGCAFAALVFLLYVVNVQRNQINELSERLFGLEYEFDRYVMDMHPTTLSIVHERLIQLEHYEKAAEVRKLINELMK